MPGSVWSDQNCVGRFARFEVVEGLGLVVVSGLRFWVSRKLW